ncbi:type 4a pilus biogenesis protein PilO [Candidatus Omnitrophota bacterium]
MKNWKQEIIKNQKLVIYGVITLCLLIANFNLFIKPTISSLKDTVPKVRDLQRQLNSANIAIANKPRYESQIKDLSGRLSSHKKRFSTERQISALLKRLSQMAQNSGVKILSIKPHPAVTNSQQSNSISAYQKFPISINAKCGYHQLSTFLNKLENADTFMRVTDIKIANDPKSIMEHSSYILINTYVISSQEDAKV